MRGYRIAVDEELRLTAPAHAGRLVLTSDLQLLPEAEANAATATAATAAASAPAVVASPPAKPARPSSASASSLAAAQQAPAVMVEDAAPAPSCFERVFGCFGKKSARA